MSLCKSFDPGQLDDVPSWLLTQIQPTNSIGAQARIRTAEAPQLPINLDEINISDRIKRLIRDGDTDGRYPSRSEALFAANCELIKAGCDDATIFATVWKPGHKIGEKPREQGKDWLHGEIARARAKSTNRASSIFGVVAWPAPLTTEAFHGLAGNIIEIIEPHSEADTASLLLQLLAMVGNVIGRSARYRVEGDFHHTNLFTLVVGETSKARKGTSFGRINHFLSLAEEEWTKDCVVSGLSSGEGLIWQVRDPRKKDPGVEDKRLLVVESEYASTLKVMSREGNTLSAIIRQAWDKGDLRSLTKNSPARATGTHISLIGHITKTELRRYLNATEAGNGFANRHLFVCSKRSKILPFGGDLTDADLQPLADRLGAAIKHAQSLDKPIGMNDDAKALWRSVYPALSEGKPGLLGSVTSRAEAQVIRLALIYAVLDQSPDIIPEHLHAALAVWRYCEASARYIFGEALGDPIADTILQALRASPQGVTRTEISDLFKRHKDKTTITGALASLQEHGLAHFTNEATGGRPIETWFATLNG